MVGAELGRCVARMLRLHRTTRAATFRRQADRWADWLRSLAPETRLEWGVDADCDGATSPQERPRRGRGVTEEQAARYMATLLVADPRDAALPSVRADLETVIAALNNLHAVTGVDVFRDGADTWSLHLDMLCCAGPYFARFH